MNPSNLIFHTPPAALWRDDEAGEVFVVADGGDRQRVLASADTFHVRHSLSSVSAVRRRIRSLLRGAGVPAATCEDAELVMGELMANAIEHARPVDGRVQVAVQVQPTSVVLSVTDGGSEEPPAPADPDLHDERGRGLRIIERLCREWGAIEHRDGRRTVTAVLQMARADS